MAIFKKISPLEGNPCKSNGVSIEFNGLYYETEDEAEIEFISGFKCYVQVDSKGSVEVKPAVTKSATGTISTAKLAAMAATNN